MASDVSFELPKFSYASAYTVHLNLLRKTLSCRIIHAWPKNFAAGGAFFSSILFVFSSRVSFYSSILIKSLWSNYCKVELLRSLSLFIISKVISNRGGVEDTRLEAKAKDSPSEDRHFRGQGLECLRPRPRTKDTNASVLQKKKKEKVLQKFFQAISTKNGLEKRFSADLQNFNHSKTSAVLEPRTDQFSRT